MNTNLLNNDLIFFGKLVTITQIMAGFNAGLETERTKNSGTLEVFYSPGTWFPDQSSGRYNDLRPGAKNAYVYGRLALQSIVRLPRNFTLEPTIRCQLSSVNLLSSEQFGLGGYNTVRGYEEREFNADNVIITNLELRTPPISLLKYVKRCGVEQKQDELRFLGFFDFGYGHNHKGEVNGLKSEYLMGIGPGLRYVIYKYLTVRLDYGWKLHQPKFSPNPLHQMFYFGAVVSI